MAEGDLRVCPHCHEIHIEDPVLRDPNRCPHCGGELEKADPVEEE